MTKFDEQLALLLDPGSSNGMIIQILYCPCDAVSRRVLNAEAVTRLIDIKEHKEEGQKMYLQAGGFEAVASKRNPIVLLPSSMFPPFPVEHAFFSSPMPQVHGNPPPLFNLQQPSSHVDQNDVRLSLIPHLCSTERI